MENRIALAIPHLVTRHVTWVRRRRVKLHVRVYELDQIQQIDEKELWFSYMSRHENCQRPDFSEEAHLGTS